ncbi:MAG TPA: ABC transporter permease [Acetobacteraceae bacterium]|nr:ABC transporter permease [Acetobacteraceae bacterium]
MGRFIARRLGLGLLTIFVTTIAVTLLIHIVPGDPVRIMYAQSQGTTDADIAAIRHRLGLDRGVFVQYGLFVGRLAQGDLGRTVRGDQPVLPLILDRLPNTLLLAAAAMVIALVLGIGAGFVSAWREGSLVDTGLMTTAIGGVAIPQFWLGLMLMLVFGVRLAWLPVGGTGLPNLVLPALTLGLGNAAIVARMCRAAMLDTMRQEFARAARARGLPKFLVMTRHVLRPGLVPVATMMGMQFAYMMGGAIVVENIFSWNGIGRLAISAIFERDYPLIQGFILVFATSVVVVSLLIDLLQLALDPRLRRQ